MNIFWRFDVGTLTASTTGSGFDVDNLALSTLSTKWQDDGTETTPTITDDVGSALPIDSIAIIGHNLEAGDTITLRMASDAGFTTAVVTETITHQTGIIYQKFTSVSRQYRRLEITKPTSVETRFIGRLAMGVSYKLRFSLKAPGYSIAEGQTTTRITRTEGGQLYADLGVSLGHMRGTIPALPQADHDELQELISTNQTGIPFVAAADLANYPVKKTIYGTFPRIPMPSDVTIDEWEYPWSMVEQK